ncbi:MAG: tight adherence protein B [Pontimonas sp.]
MDRAAMLVSLALGVGVWLVAEGFLRAPPESDGVQLRRRPSRTLGKVRALLREAGHPRVDPLVFLVTGVLAALGVGITVSLLIPIPVLSVLAGVGMWCGALGYVTKQRDARYQRLQQAWPGLIDHLRAGIRSGSDVTMAVVALPDSLPPDIVNPLVVFRADIRRGMDTDTAVGELAERFANPVGDRICEVLRMAHEVGGTDLPGVLLQLQHSVRADIAVREDARAAQSWIRSTALLALAAPWIVLVVIGTREQTVAAYQTLEGTLILMVGALVSVVAFRMMRSIGELPPATRWLA